MHFEFGQPIRDLAPLSCKEGGPDTIGDMAQPQVNAGRLDLGIGDRAFGGDSP
jgi:hypothetical protein